MKKKRLTARINFHNYNMIRAIANTVFYDEKRNEGNMSKALDWILTTFRLYTRFKGIVSFLEAFSNTQQGSRTREDIEKTKDFQTLMKIIVDQMEEKEKNESKKSNKV